MTRSSTWTSSPCCTPMSAASMPIGPAPVTSAVRGSQNARARMAATISQALATTVVGSSRTPSRPRAGSSLVTKLGLDPPSLRHEAVELLDAPLGVLPVAAHVPLTHRAVAARHRVRAPDDAHDEVPGLQPGCRPRVEDPAQGLVSEHEPVAPRWGPTVVAGGNLDVGPADPDCHGLHEHRPGALLGLGHLLVAHRSRHAGLHGHCLHRTRVSQGGPRQGSTNHPEGGMRSGSVRRNVSTEFGEPRRTWWPGDITHPAGGGLACQPQRARQGERPRRAPFAAWP